MKRGLIEWNPEELSREVLDGRVARCQALLAERGLDAAVCYTSVAQPGLSRYFVHFLPYWNEGVLVLPRDGDPMLCVGLSNRVFPWIKSSSTLTEIRASRNLGADAAKVLQERGARRVGLADRGSIPHRIIAELQTGLADGEVVDLPQVVETLALGLDADELRLRAEAGQRVAAALAEAGTPGAAATDSALAAHLDRAVRLAGAEDVLVLVGPGGQWPGLPRKAPLDGPTNVMMQVEYKGHWVQVGRALGAAGSARPAAAALGSLCQPGRTVRELVTAARREHGLDAFVSRSGRGNPFVGLAENERLAEGDIVAILALQAGSAGLLCGDTFAVQAGSAKALS
jgi:hypothetical protein